MWTIASVAALTLVKWAYPPIGDGVPFLLYFVVAVGAAWLGGRGAGVFATAVAAAVGNFFFLGGRHGFELHAVPLMKTGGFVLESLALTIFVDVVRRSRAEQAAQALDRAVILDREVRLRHRLEVLASAASGLSRASTLDEVAKVVVDEGMKAMSADTCTLYVLDSADDALELVAHRGVPALVIDRIRRITAESSNPSWTAFQSSEALWVETAKQYAERMPAVATIDAEGPRAKAFWSVPLIVEGRAVGLLGMGYHHERAFPAEKRTFVATFAQQCAQALLRAQRLERETAARRAAEEAHAEIAREETRRAIVADATVTLAASLDYETTLGRLATMLVPQLCDWCAIEMIDEATGASEQLAVAHGDLAMVDRAWELRRRYPPIPDAATGVQAVLRTGKSEIYPAISDEMLAASARDPEYLALARALKLRSALIVPLAARGTVLGAITMVHAESGRRYTSVDLALAEEIARRAGIAVDNARLYRREQHARAGADEANRLKDEFLATISHELRTPLNAILGWSRMLRTGAVEESRREKSLEIIERNAIAMAQLIEDLLDVSRIISGKMRLESVSVDLAQVVAAAVETLRPASTAKEIVVRQALEPVVGRVVGDPNRLQQVVWNLLSNAIKFTPRAGTVEIHVREHGPSVEIEISDSGAGIEASFLPYVFDRFRQADGRTTRTHGGLGLGLAITRQLVELHGGSIEARSEGVSRGATFTVKLPVSVMRPLDVERPALEPAGGAAKESPPELVGLKVLAVDDDADSLDLVVSVLESAGAVVIGVNSVASAMASILSVVPDVIVSDIGMPEADGFELLRRVRALPPKQGGEAPAAALTAYVRAGDRTRVLDAGYLMHVAKPVEPDELLAVVASLARAR